MNPTEGAADALLQLLEVMRRLRDPHTGCPWDQAQTAESLAPYTLEEAYEVVDVIQRGALLQWPDELGDLLFQIIFQAQLAAEQGRFNFASVAAGIANKLERRHPHVFGDAALRDAVEQTRQWEAHKASERRASGGMGALNGVALALPALARANKLGKRAARVRFEWPDRLAVRDKVNEEWRELAETLQPGSDPREQFEEFGDLLFALAQYARHLHIDPEAALRAANRKFERRFAAMETLAREAALNTEQLDLGQWETLWQQVKARERSGGR